jgi:hypothetical protein
MVGCRIVPAACHVLSFGDSTGEIGPPAPFLVVMKPPFLLFLLFVTAASAVDFNRDVRPVLAQQCFTCHGMDDQARKGRLRLDLSESAHGAGKSGEIAIVPGKPDASEVVKRILSTDEDEVMPPPHTKKVLSDKDKATLKAWIAEGAKYEAHWAYTPPKQPVVPGSKFQVSSSKGSSAQLETLNLKPETQTHPIDGFIRERLAKEGLKPSPEADRLHARPPRLSRSHRPAADARRSGCLRQSINQTRSDRPSPAYEKLVDSLLNSKHYGERWARRWLDLARYADTNGFEKDRPRQIWPYRDWVVKALNDDMPFDQFSIKQLAGDMLPNATPDDLIATGFHRNTMLNEEGGIDPNEYRFYAMVDRVGVTGTAWMGLTLNCCQCHTHKYDPILHTEYYSVMALLNNADEPTYHIPTPDIEAQQKAHAERSRSWRPICRKNSPEARRRCRAVSPAGSKANRNAPRTGKSSAPRP